MSISKAIEELRSKDLELRSFLSSSDEHDVYGYIYEQAKEGKYFNYHDALVNMIWGVIGAYECESCEEEVKTTQDAPRYINEYICNDCMNSACRRCFQEITEENASLNSDTLCSYCDHIDTLSSYCDPIIEKI